MPRRQFSTICPKLNPVSGCRVCAIVVSGFERYPPQTNHGLFQTWQAGIWDYNPCINLGA